MAKIQIVGIDLYDSEFIPRADTNQFKFTIY